MNTLHKDGIRAAMSENTERETLERMGQRSETVSNDTLVRQEDVVNATVLIAHLEAGGLIARGDPRHVEFLRFEIYGENRVKHLGSYGWGSALGRVEDRLMDVLKDPHEWVRIPIDTARDDYETVAAKLLSETGEYENYDWRLTLWDYRPINTPTPQPDLLATVRREAFKEAATLCRAQESPEYDIEVMASGWEDCKLHCAEILEASANSEKGDNGKA